MTTWSVTAATNGWMKVSTSTVTLEQAQELAAQFPKSVNFGRNMNLGGDPEHKGYVQFEAVLASNGVNGGVNETGVKRYRTFRKHAERLGHTVQFEKFSNAYTEDEFHAHLNASAPFDGRA